MELRKVELQVVMLVLGSFEQLLVLHQLCICSCFRALFLSQRLCVCGTRLLRFSHDPHVIFSIELLLSFCLSHVHLDICHKVIHKTNNTTTFLFLEEGRGCGRDL